jgi:hypothetical protein
MSERLIEQTLFGRGYEADIPINNSFYAKVLAEFGVAIVQ